MTETKFYARDRIKGRSFMGGIPKTLGTGILLQVPFFYRNHFLHIQFRNSFFFSLTTKRHSTKTPCVSYRFIVPTPHMCTPPPHVPVHHPLPILSKRADPFVITICVEQKTRLLRGEYIQYNPNHGRKVGIKLHIRFENTVPSFHLYKQTWCTNKI